MACAVTASQADVKPGCVLRAANIGQVLEARGLLTVDEVGAGPTLYPRAHTVLASQLGCRLVGVRVSADAFVPVCLAMARG